MKYTHCRDLQDFDNFVFSKMNTELAHDSKKKLNIRIHDSYKRDCCQELFVTAYHFYLFI